MGLYRKKSKTVEAIQLTPDTADYLVGWCGGQRLASKDALDPTKEYVELNVPTLSGVIRCSEGDYVVKDEFGFHMLRKDAFEAKYELIS